MRKPRDLRVIWKAVHMHSPSEVLQVVWAIHTIEMVVPVQQELLLGFQVTWAQADDARGVQCISISFIMPDCSCKCSGARHSDRPLIRVWYRVHGLGWSGLVRCHRPAEDGDLYLAIMLSWNYVSVMKAILILNLVYANTPTVTTTILQLPMYLAS